MRVSDIRFLLNDLGASEVTPFLLVLLKTDHAALAHGGVLILFLELLWIRLKNKTLWSLSCVLTPLCHVLPSHL